MTAMPEFMNSGAVRRLESYFGRIGDVLGSDGRRASFAKYAMGLLGGAERKSVEPIAAQACAEVTTTDAEHQRLLHFLANSPWSDRDVRREATRYALSAMNDREPIEAWIIDDTGFLKQGSHSVGVQRQYTGSAGKVTNCQVAVSLSVATKTEHLPIDFELYLPESWTGDPARRREARIPDAVTFKTKPELALEMIRRATQDGVSTGVLLADAGYGSSRDFRHGVRNLGLHYIVGVDPKTVVAVFDRVGRRRDDPVSVRDLAFRIAKKGGSQGGFRRCTWRKGTKDDLSARFALRRIVPAYDQCHGMEKREPLWLLIEWRDGETEPANYFLSSLSSRMTKANLVRLAMQRWRTERVYEDLKGELGLDHYEGRRYPGWNHHVSVALSCYAFIIAERVRRFPPSARRSLEANPQSLAA